jgi:hypothetical protein
MILAPSIPTDKLDDTKVSVDPESVIPSALSSIPTAIDPVAIEVILKIFWQRGSFFLNAAGSRLQSDARSLFTLVRALAS